MERKLATIRIVSELLPIPDADLIELAIVDGWQVVVGKGNFEVGDHVIYCEIDSFLPVREEFEFLRKSSFRVMNNIEGFRLKTIKLRKQVSQGLLIPLHDIPEMEQKFVQGIGYFWEEGDDVTELLGIVKYEPMQGGVNLSGDAKGNFPSFIFKTDEERIQNLTRYYDKYKEYTFYVTEKLDGSSITMYLKDGEFGVCSRNIDLKDTEHNTFWKAARAHNIEEKLRDYGKNIAIQGELIGEGIQGNPYKLKGHHIRIFNVFHIDTASYFDFELFKDWCNHYKLETVPVLDTHFELPETIKEMVEYADGKSVLNHDFNREGVVVRSLNRKHSFKAISNIFLLKEK